MLTRRVQKPKLLSIDHGDPAAVLISTADAKNYLNVTFGTEDDALIDMLVDASRLAVEDYTHRSLINRTVTVRYEGSTLPVRLHAPPFVELTSLKTYYEGAETATAVSNVYVLGASGTRPQVRFKSTGEFTANEIQEIEAAYTAGYGEAASNVPEVFITAAKIILNDLYDKRGSFIKGKPMQNIPGPAERLLNRHVVRFL